MMHPIADKIRELREARSWTQDDLSEKAGVHRVTIAKYEAGKVEPKSTTLDKLAKAFGVSTDFLLGRESNVTKQVQDDQRGGAIRIPVLGTIPAGIPIEAIEDIIDWEEIPASMAKGGQEYFALQVRGLSMYPEYRDGDIVIARRQETCESGQDVIAMVNAQDATFKRYKRTEQGIILQAINPEYDSYMYTMKEVNSLPVRILGVVVELRRKF